QPEVAAVAGVPVVAAAVAAVPGVEGRKELVLSAVRCDEGETAITLRARGVGSMKVSQAESPAKPRSTSWIRNRVELVHRPTLAPGPAGVEVEGEVVGEVRPHGVARQRDADRQVAVEEIDGIDVARRVSLVA